MLLSWKGKVIKVIRAILYILRFCSPRNNFLDWFGKLLRLRSNGYTVKIQDIKQHRYKDTIFIMGCGYSINDITETEWERMASDGDILSFNEFFKGKFVPIDYHICGEIAGVPNYGSVLLNKEHIKDYYHELFNNPYYEHTLFFLRYKASPFKKFLAPIPTAIWAYSFLKTFRHKPVCLYGIVTREDTVLEPSNDIYTVSHYAATLCDAVNISYILGYKKIVLVGVDLYDRRYFWLGKDETRVDDLRRGHSCSDIHNTGKPIVEVMDMWNKYMSEKGVQLYIYNPRSLLCQVLPLYQFGREDVQA